VSRENTEFAEFFRASWEPCLRAVAASTGSAQLAEDQVAEAFARAWLSWRTVRRHPAPRAWVVRTALNAGASWWRKWQVANPGAVRRALAEHGIPALVTAGQFCRTAIQPPPGVGEVVVLSGPKHLTHAPGPKPGPVFIYGSKIPRGVQLSIGYRQDAQENEISFTLIVAGAPLTCTSIPDHGPHPDDGPPQP
jgi:Sigma-70 region 2